jgi:hypothetical protein
MNDTDDVAVVSAIVAARQKRKPKLPPVERARRFAAEKALQQRRYCDAFALWHRCRRKICRRQQRCTGEQTLCLRQALERVPHRMQWQTRQQFLKTMPPNIGAPERDARQRMPSDLYEQGRTGLDGKCGR